LWKYLLLNVSLLHLPKLRRKRENHNEQEVLQQVISTSAKMDFGASPSKFVSRSLSVVDMMRLGKVISKKTTSVQIYAFDIKGMSWSETPIIAEFTIEPEPFGVGGFRKAFKSTSHHKSFEGSTWVIKKYLRKVKLVIKNI
jgi:hypothetical protein